ncbi:N-formylglutamate amidohydrolase [Pseudooceanicola sp.]|uniref:N-formylglutamate amidohydrolase n=1 Tax=Pseudooceanicola sp. TaxID=1914328 RepID=UPI002617377D|nr:N-formylglutamate amidohydrolase [Pseudooceanicola sp.]MDF1856008.1 N-formylglutamate amidohydrolase [Pseudooceanicola sp.]
MDCLNPDGSGPLVLVCEHASAYIPAALNGLGLSDADRLSHAAWDPGALAVAQAMSAALDAPLVAARVSRLVYDCNRPPDAPNAMPARSEVIEVPGNRDLSAAQRAARSAAIYDPFQARLRATLAAHPGAALVTVHSFTPTWFGQPRAAEIGLLHDADDRLAAAMLAGAQSLPAKAALNVPYAAADGVTHTLKLHGAGRRNVMIEIRNDLIATPEAAAAMGQALADLIRLALGTGAAQ